MDPLTANVANAVTGAGLELTINDEGEVDMCEAIINLKARAKAEGEACGEARGEARGEEKLAKLVQKLIDAGRVADLKKASADQEYRAKLYKEFGVV